MEKKELGDSLKSISEACDEAENLLDALDINDKQERSDIQNEDTPPELDTPKPSNYKATNKSAGGCAMSLWIGLVIIVAAALISQGRKETYATQNEYRQAMNLARNAVLISEHQKAIKELNSVKEKGINPNTMNNGLLNNRIIQARKAILFLNQKGKRKYEENSEYGYQWFNNQDRNAFKVFFAHSRKCKTPLITFRHSRRNNGPIAKVTRIRPKSTLSTIRIPFALRGGEWIGIHKFRCN